MLRVKDDIAAALATTPETRAGNAYRWGWPWKGGVARKLRYFDVECISDRTCQILLALADIRPRELFKSRTLDEFIDNKAFVFLPVMLAAASSNASSEIISHELDKVSAPRRFDSVLEPARSVVCWRTRIKVYGSRSGFSKSFQPPFELL